MDPLTALLAKLSGLRGGWNPDVQQSGVRPDEPYTSDIYTEKPVPAKDLEILLPDGTWAPLVGGK